MGKLDGKVAIVTGASRGIGAEIARLFAQEGSKVICAARTLREGDHPLEGSLEGTISGIREAGGEATAVAANVSETEECEKLVQAARDTYGPADILVNNAALTYFIPVKEFPVNRWLRSWLVNFQAPFILSQLVLQDMISRGSGNIVNISSASAVGPGDFFDDRSFGASHEEVAAREQTNPERSHRLIPPGLEVGALQLRVVLAAERGDRAA